jgi:YSIRK type signal peptide
MSLRKLSVGIASVLVLAAGVPAFANEAAITQENVQTTRASGRNASATSNSTQDASIRQRGRNGNEAGIGQSSDQLTEATSRRGSATSTSGQVGNIDQSGRRR